MMFSFFDTVVHGPSTYASHAANCSKTINRETSLFAHDAEVTEWPCGGLQIRIREFNSPPRPQCLLSL